MQKIDIENFLYSLIRPGRYTDNELNTKKKQVSEDYYNIALAFPDLYEIGMSHLGLKILYSIINSHEHLVADRVYTPDFDLIALLRKKSIPLFSLEDHVALQEFDLIGFTLQYELSCTNILLMLDLAQLPLYSEERKDSDPLIIAGGPGAFNPESLSSFIDAFVIGDGEDVLIEIAELLRENKSITREEKLYLLTKIQGVYVPTFYKQIKNKSGTYIVPKTDGVPSKIKKRFFSDFNNPEKIHTPQLMPLIDIIHRRPAFEIMRGCSRGCRFCQAGIIYRPVRERDISLIVDLVAKDISCNGWEEISLNSLSTSDYSGIQPLLNSLIDRLSQSNITISLPSLRMDTFEENFQPKLAKILRKTITLAPEAGSQKLRDSINKNISDNEIIHSITQALKLNITSIKLYFMLGLPGETHEDIEGVITLIDKIHEVNPKKITKINVSIAPFVPKAHTPFQWSRQDTPEELFHKISTIKNHFSKQKKIIIKYHTIEQSQLEAVIARGDRDIGKLIDKAYHYGCYFDSWNIYFDYSLWRKAAKELQIDYTKYLQSIPTDDKLPWDHIDCGIHKHYLIEEYNKSKKILITKDCRNGSCTGCGVCENMSPIYADPLSSAQINTCERIPYCSDEESRFMYKVIYQKGDKLRFISHKEISAIIYTILRKSSLPVCHTKGFNRRPKISFGPPLSLGLVGHEEFFMFMLYNKITENEVREKLDVNLPQDFCIKKVAYVNSSSKMNFTEENIRITSDNQLIDWQKIYNFRDTFFYSERKKREIFLSEYFRKVIMFSNGVDIFKKIGLNIFELLEKAFHYSPNEIATFYIERIKIY